MSDVTSKELTSTTTAATTMATTTAPFSVQGKTAIVTGAGSGICYHFAALLLSKGCNVLLADLTLRPEAEALLTQYSSTPRALFQQTDVTSWSQLERMFTTARTALGPIDIVCPGAGIYDPHWTNFWHPPGSPASKDAVDAGRYISLDVNLVHPIRTTQLALAEFLTSSPSASSDSDAERGAKASLNNPKRVVLISSIAGQSANLVTPLYVAAKHAINGLIRSMSALEGRTGIRVNGVAPGVIKTPLWTEHPEKLKFVDEGRDEWATPEEVAEAMLRCMEDSALVGGTVLEVGAGQTRLVAQYNDPGPSGRGHTVSNALEAYEEVFGWLGEEGWGQQKGV